MIAQVKVSYLSQDELLQYRIGSKCDLKDKPNAKRDWKWRSDKGLREYKEKRRGADPYGRH